MVGAYAVAFHGAPRYTGDLDVLVEPAEENASRLVDALRRFGFQSPQIDAGDFVAKDRVVQLGVPPVRIDLLTSIAGLSFREAHEGRVDAVVDGVRISFIGREHLIRNKRSTGRLKDLADAEVVDSKTQKPSRE